MPSNNDLRSNAKAFEELRRMQQENEEKSVASKTQDRRYVGTKESIGFIIWDAAQSFNINIFSTRFITSIVGVDLGLQTVVNTINSVWDIVNDIFFGAVIDKTRTRWGKFRPYLMFLAIPGCVLTCLYWLMPHLFEGTTQTDFTKLAFYLILTIAREGITTFQTISRTGLMSTITPHPNDRTRLITLANFASGFFGEKIPEQAVTILIDVLRSMYLNDAGKLAKAYTNLFVGMGCFTTIASSASSFWFFYNSKERVMQSIKTPSVLMSTITPHPNDRTRLITLANFASGFFGEKLPEQAVTILIDVLRSMYLNDSGKLAKAYTNLFVGMGCFTTIASSASSFWFFHNSRERVMQSIKTPSVLMSIKSVIRNKPLLLITLSDFLSGFAIKGSEDDYYTDVLHFSSMTLVAGIPAAPISPMSYAWVPWMRRRFSSRLLYILAKEIGNILYIPVFLFGCIGMKKDYSGGMYQKVVPMGFAMALWEIIWTLFFGLKSVIGTEMYNEAMDYCEWKNGYRTEAMASVAKGIAAKVSSNTSAVVTTAIKKMIGYEANAFRMGTEQTDKVKFFLFAMFTVIPAVTGSLGIIPMLFYDLNNDKKEKMYAELLERRKLMSDAVESDNEDMLKLAAEAQINIGK